MRSLKEIEDLANDIAARSHREDDVYMLACLVYDLAGHMKKGRKRPPAAKPRDAFVVRLRPVVMKGEGPKR